MIANTFCVGKDCGNAAISSLKNLEKILALSSAVSSHRTGASSSDSVPELGLFHIIIAKQTLKPQLALGWDFNSGSGFFILG